MDEQQLKRIAAHPGRIPMDDASALVAEVRRLQAKVDEWQWGYAEAVRNEVREQERRIKAEQELIQLQADYAEAVARAIKAEEEIERLSRRLAIANHRVVA